MVELNVPVKYYMFNANLWFRKKGY